MHMLYVNFIFLFHIQRVELTRSGKEALVTVPAHYDDTI